MLGQEIKVREHYVKFVKSVVLDISEHENRKYLLGFLASLP